MKWEIVRRLLVVAGVAYIFMLVPANLKPSWSAAPLRKPNQTITIQADSERGAIGPTATTDIAKACKPMWILRPIMGAAKSVRVLAMWNKEVVNVSDFNCGTYVK